MNIKEGLEASTPDQEKNSSLSGRNRLIDGNIAGRSGRWYLPYLLAAGNTFLAMACGAPSAFSDPASPEVRPTATAVGIGSTFVPIGNEEIDNIQKRLMDPATKNQVPEKDILKFNEAISKRAEGTATAEAQKPTPEANREPIECAFLPDCSGAELIEWVDTQGNKSILVGFDPNPGTPLLAYENGQLTKEKHDQKSILRGFGLTVINPKDPKQYLSLHGDIDIGEFRTQNISQGNKIGEVQDTGVTNFGHRLIAYASEDILRSVIPSVFSQKAKRFEGPPPVTGPVVTSKGQATPIYANVPPPQ